MVTIIQCISAEGVKVPLFIIFRETKYHIRNLIYVEPESNRMFPYFRNEWTNGTLWEKCFKNFEKHTKISNTNEQRLFLFFRYKLDHIIGLISLPAHATYLLQPLDVRLFSPLFNAYCRKLDTWRAAGNKNIN